MRLVYDKLSKAIVTVIVDDSSITSFPAENNVMQSDADSLLEMALAVGINMPELIEYFETNNITYAMTPELEAILKDRAWGINFANTLIDKLKNVDALSIADRGTLLNKVHLFLTVLSLGDIDTARAIMNNYATDTILTVARKNWVLSEIDTYLQ